MALVSGWGRGTWGEGAWSEEVPIALSGLSATSGLGSVSVTGSAVVSEDSVSGASATGQVTTEVLQEVQVTGVSGTGQNTAPDILGDANFSITGVDATGAVGTVDAQSVAEVTGVSARGLVNDTNTYTTNGNAAISTNQSKFGGSSLELDGTGDYVVSDATYNFGADPFTIDLWIYPADATQDTIVFDSRDSTSNPAIAIRQATDNLLIVRGNSTLFNINNVFSTGVWTHVAVTRGDPFNNTYTVFVDGVNSGSTLTGVTSTAADLYIGCDFNQSNNFDGYIDELRVSTIDRYGGSGFTPPTSAYVPDSDTSVLLHFDGANGSTLIIDDAPVGLPNVTVTGAANIVPTGVEDTGQIGTPFIFLEQKITAPSFLATGAVGDASVEGVANIYPTGASSTADVGSVVPFAGADVNVTGEEATSALGTVTPFAGAKPTPSGVSATGENVFIVVAVGDANVYPTGVSGTIDTSSPNVWSQITPNVSQTWSEVAA